MWSIDRLKRINDTHGHLAGDYVLRELSGIIADNLRREDVFARYGGEEFAIVFPEIDGAGQAVQVADKLRGLIETHEFSFANEVIPVTMSFGVHATRGEAEHLEVADFIAGADAQLYEAKEKGRHRVCLSP